MAKVRTSIDVLAKAQADQLSRARNHYFHFLQSKPTLDMHDMTSFKASERIVQSIWSQRMDFT